MGLRVLSILQRRHVYGGYPYKCAQALPPSFTECKFLASKHSRPSHIRTHAPSGKADTLSVWPGVDGTPHTLLH